MLNTNTRRVTELEDVEAHINGNHVARYAAHQDPVITKTESGGRWWPAEAATDIGANDTKDAESQLPEGGLIALLFVMAVACIGVLAFIVSIARSAQ